MNATAGRVPPADLDAEAAVLSACMLDERALVEVSNILQPLHFYADANRRIYMACLALRESSKPVDFVAVSGHLRDAGRLEQIGGAAYLAQITDATPCVANVAAHAQTIFKKWQQRAAISRFQTLESEGYGQIADIDAFLTRAAAALTDIGRAPPVTPLSSHWLDLSPEFLSEPPPPQVWLLKQWRDGRDHGVFPRGRTGLFTATGGVGKTNAVTALAVAVASGGFWYDTFRVVEPGHVLLALGEEDLDEARRRIWRAVNAAGLTAEQKKETAARLHLLPLHGVATALTCSPEPGKIASTVFSTELKNKLNGFGVDWSLLIFDPLSRWAGGGIEANNEFATRFVQEVETLANVRGTPSVLLAHHSSQVSTRAGESDARGVTGIRDGFRWQASLDAVATEDGSVRGVLLRNRKSNYSPEFKPMLLVRNSEPGLEGTLRPATKHEEEALQAFLPSDRQSAEQRANAKQNRNKDAFDADCGQVLAVLPAAPDHVSSAVIDTRLRGLGFKFGDKKLKSLLEHLASADGGGRVVDLSNGAQSSQRQWAKKDGP